MRSDTKSTRDRTESSSKVCRTRLRQSSTSVSPPSDSDNVVPHRLVYAPGSLYTSILPCLALRSVGTLIATSPSLTHKILLLNSTLDRETPNYSSIDFVKAISLACNRCYGEDEQTKRTFEPREFVTHVVYLEGSEVGVEKNELEVNILSITVLRRA